MVLAYVLVLNSLPLAPLLSLALHPHAEAGCTHLACPSKRGAPCPHHADAAHAEAGHAGHHGAMPDGGPTFKACSAHDATPALVLVPALDKALLPGVEAPAPRADVPPGYAALAEAPPPSSLTDVFHPPRTV